MRDGSTSARKQPQWISKYGDGSTMVTSAAPHKESAAETPAGPPPMTSTDGLGEVDMIVRDWAQGIEAKVRRFRKRNVAHYISVVEFGTGGARILRHGCDS